MDDRIRMQVYRRIYGQPDHAQVHQRPSLHGEGPSVAMAAGGITQDPPLGYHAIHIIVNNGHVILTGVVDSQATRISRPCRPISRRTSSRLRMTSRLLENRKKPRASQNNESERGGASSDVLCEARGKI